MLVHNGNAVGVLLAVAGAMVLLGFGCTTPDRAIPAAENGENTPTAQDDDTNDADSTDAPIIAWTTYESPTLGLRIPYPEGWYVEEDDGGSTGTVLRFHETPTPSTPTEYPARLWFQSYAGSSDDLLASFRSEDIVERTAVTRAGRQMERVVLLNDFYGRTVSFLWARNGKTLRLTGPEDDPIVEATIQRMEE